MRVPVLGNVMVPDPRFVAAAIDTDPALTVNPQVPEFEPLRVNVPAPTFVSVPVPEMAPETSKALPLLMLPPPLERRTGLVKGEPVG
jgi:hypothetical protein